MQMSIIPETGHLSVLHFYSVLAIDSRFKLVIKITDYIVIIKYATVRKKKE